EEAWRAPADAPAGRTSRHRSLRSGRKRTASSIHGAPTGRPLGDESFYASNSIQAGGVNSTAFPKRVPEAGSRSTPSRPPPQCCNCSAHLTEYGKPLVRPVRLEQV